MRVCVLKIKATTTWVVRYAALGRTTVPQQYRTTASRSVSTLYLAEFSGDHPRLPFSVKAPKKRFRLYKSERQVG